LEKQINPTLEKGLQSQRKQDFHTMMGAVAARADFRSGLGNLKTFEPWKELTGWIDAYSPQAPSVNERSGQKLSTVFTCLNVLRETRGSLPCSVMQSSPKGRKVVYSNPVHYLVHDRPNPHMTAFTFWGLMELYKKAWGNAYAEVERGSDMWPVAFWPRAPWEVEVRSRGRDLIYVYKGREILESNMLHFKNYTDDGILGKSSIRQNGLSIGLGLKLKDYNLSIVGERPYGFLTTEATVKDKQQKERMRSQWNDKGEDVDKDKPAGSSTSISTANGRLPLLYGGVKFVPLTLPADDVAYIESAKITDREIYGIFRMLPTFAQDWEKAPYNSSEQQDIHFVKYTLAGVREDEQECNEKLFPESNKRSEDGLYVKFNLSGLLRGDISARMLMYRTLINLSVMTPAQAAELEDLPIEDVMKRYYVQGAMVPADKVDDFINSKGAKQTVQQQQEEEAQRAKILQELRDTIRPRLNGSWEKIADLFDDTL